MKKILLPLLSAAIILSCKDKKDKPADPAPAQPAPVAASPADDSVAIRKVITDFYNWYVKNDQKLLSYRLYDGVKKTDRPPYRINWAEVDKYQAFLRDSVPQLGQAFQDNQKKFFQQCDSALKVDTEDEIPYGFDFDWFTNSQEDPKYLADEVNKPLPWKIKWNGDEATVEVQGEFELDGVKKTNTFITIIVKKENGNWKIAKTWGDL